MFIPGKLVKIVFFIPPIDPEKSVYNTQTSEHIPELIFYAENDTQLRRQQEKNTEATYNHAHSIVHNRSSDPVPLRATIQVLFFRHDHSFIRDRQYTEKA
jgi:hypothetical protein